MNVLDIFYNQIVEEASHGEIDAFFKYNVLFSTKIGDKTVEADSKLTEKYLVPTLIIKDKEKFDRLLCEYIDVASKFYTYYEEFYSRIRSEDRDVHKELWRVKILFVNLFSNATEEDFNNPCEYLRRRIAFINNTCEKSFEDFYSEELKATMKVSIKKEAIYNETPYMFCVDAIDEKGIPYSFPSVKFGIHDGKAYVYAIQKKKTDDQSKKINRGLYKTGEGFDAKVDNEEIYEEGNLKDVTASFLIAANLFVTYLSSIGINEVVVPSIFIERFNAKEMVYDKKLKFHSIDIDSYLEKRKEHEELQSNLTEKLIRTFNRLSHHYPNFRVLSYPSEVDMALHLDTSNQECCNNKLLLELRGKFINNIERKGIQI